MWVREQPSTPPSEQQVSVQKLLSVNLDAAALLLIRSSGFSGFGLCCLLVVEHLVRRSMQFGDVYPTS